MILVNDISSLTGLSSVAANETAFVKGYYSPNDLGGGEFYYDAGSTATVNDGTVFSSAAGGRWIRLFDGKCLNARQFGASGDPSGNDTVALQTAIDYCGSNGLGLYIPNGRYRVIAPGSFFGLTIQYSGTYIEGDGYDTEIFALDYNQYNSVLGVQATSGQIQNVVVKNLRINGNNGAQSGAWNGKCITVVCINSNSAPQDIIMEGLYCHNAYSDVSSGEGGGIQVNGTDTNTMTDYYPANIHILNCFCYDNTGWGIGSNRVNGLSVSNNTCWNNQTMGITLFNTQDSVIVGNICYNNIDYGINLELCDRITATGNNIIGNDNGCFKTYNTVDVVATGNTLIRSSTFYLFANFHIVSGPGYSGYKERPCSKILISNNNMILLPGGEGFLISASANPGGYSPNHDIVIEANTLNNQSVNKGIEGVIDNVMIANNTMTGRIYVSSTSGEAFVQNNKVYYPDCQSSVRMIEINTSYKVIVSGNSCETGANGLEAIYINVNPGYFALICENTSSGAFSAAVGPGSGVTYTNRNNLNY